MFNTSTAEPPVVPPPTVKAVDPTDDDDEPTPEANPEANPLLQFRPLDVEVLSGAPPSTMASALAGFCCYNCSYVIKLGIREQRIEGGARLTMIYTSPLVPPW